MLKKTALVLLLSLSACSAEPFDIEISGPLGRPQLTLKETAGLFQSAPCVYRLLITRAEPGDPFFLSPDAPVVWSVENPERCAPLPELTYGQAPTGLRSTTPAVPLREGVRYQIWGEASGSQRGSALVIFEHGAWRVTSDR
jgi:hypothetical protein